MAGFWESNSLTVDNMSKLGPFVDGIVGTDGKYSVLNNAIAAGWTKMLLSTGASLNADLTLGSNVSIISRHTTVSIAGNFCINVAGNDCYLEGLSISNNTGKGIYVTGQRVRMFRVIASYCLTHGIHLNSSATGDHELISVLAFANTGDGINIAASNYTRIICSRAQSNTGWGVNDLSNVVQMSSSLVYGNTAGQISGTKTYVSSSVRIA